MCTRGCERGAAARRMRVKRADVCSQILIAGFAIAEVVMQQLQSVLPREAEIIAGQRS